MATPPDVTTPDKPTIAVVDTNQMRRAAMLAFLAGWAERENVQLVELAPDQLRDTSHVQARFALVVLSLGGSSLSVPRVAMQMRVAAAVAPGQPVLVVSDRCDTQEITLAFSLGSRGFVPTDMDRALALKAFSFVLAGGTYFPPSVLLPARNDGPAGPEGTAGPMDGGGGSRHALIAKVSLRSARGIGLTVPFNGEVSGAADMGTVAFARSAECSSDCGADRPHHVVSAASTPGISEREPTNVTANGQGHVRAVTNGHESEGLACASDRDGDAPIEVASVVEELTLRQSEVLAHLRRGQPNKIIARELGLTEGTVKVHVRQIMRKLGAVNLTQAAVLCQPTAVAERSRTAPPRLRAAVNYA